jgi:ribulose-phosphate 3-epimerase
MFEIIPGILEKDWSAIEQKLEQVKPFAKSVHVDFIDGKFAPNTTFLDPKPFAKYAKDFVLELHMMVEDPLQYIKPWADAGFQRFVAHIEKMPDQAAFVADAQLWGEVGLALDKDTSRDELKVSLEDLDSLLFMTVKAGFSGQQFEESALAKIKQLGEEVLIPIETDGGINEETIEIAYAAGARRFVATSFLFAMDTPEKQYELLKRKLEALQLI